MKKIVEKKGMTHRRALWGALPKLIGRELVRLPRRKRGVVVSLCLGDGC